MSTWNPADKHANVTLSGGDLTASESTDGERYDVRGTQSRASGQYYFEILTDADGSAIGLMVGASSLVGLIGAAAADYGFIYSGGTFYRHHNSSLSGVTSGLSISQPMTLMIAVDLDAGKLWAGYNGTWAGGGNPAAGTGALYTGVSGTFFPAWGGGFNGPSTGVGRFASGSTAYAPPTGFAPWDGIPAGTTVGAAAGVAAVAGVGFGPAFAVGNAAGTSTAIALVPGAATFASAGVAAASAAGLAAAVGTGSAYGRCAVSGTPVNITTINWLVAPDAHVDVRARYGDISHINDGPLLFPPYAFGTAASAVIDDNKAVPWVAPNGTSMLAVALGTNRMVDTLVIWSSGLNVVDQMAYETFTEPGDNGLIGGTDDKLRVFIQDQIDNTVLVATVTANRATKLVIPIIPRLIKGIILIGIDTALGAYQGIKNGTKIQEVEALQTHTAYEETVVDGAVATDALIAVHRNAWESTADAAATLSGRRIANLVDGGQASATVVGIETEQAVGRSAGVSRAKAYTILEEVLVDGGHATSTVVTKRTLKLQSTGALSTALSGKLTHSETSSGTAVSGTEGESSVTQTEESTGVATDTVIGIRRVTVIEESGAIVTPDAPAKKIAESTLLSSAIASASVLTSSVQSETLESIGYAEDFLQLPFQGSFPVFWANSRLAAGATWEGLPFNSFIERDGVIYAAGPDGIYELADDLDDLEVEVPSEIEWDLVDHGFVAMKRMRSVYVNAKTAYPFTVRVANEQGIFNYQTDPADSTQLTNHRAPIGRGITSRFVRLSLLHTKGYAAENAGVGVLPSTRRI